MTDIIRLGRRGDLVLPRRVRATLGLREGDELLVSCDQESIVLRRKARRFGEYLDRLRRASPERDRE